MKICIVDDHALFRDGLRGLIEHRYPDAAVHEAATLDQALEAIHQAPDLDVVLLDLAIPGAEGLSALEAVRRADAAVPVAVVSATVDPRLAQRCLSAGAGGYITKAEETEEIVRGVEAVLEGELYMSPGLTDSAAQEPAWVDDAAARLPDLTPRQREILSRLRQGRSNKEIAHALNLSETTVKVHVTAILKALGLDNRTQAALLAEHVDL